MVAQLLRMKEAVHAWLAAQPKTFFPVGIKRLVQRWKKCIEKQGDYVEKWYYFKFSVFIEMKLVSVLRIFTDSHTYITETINKCRKSVNGTGCEQVMMYCSLKYTTLITHPTANTWQETLLTPIFFLNWSTKYSPNNHNCGNRIPQGKFLGCPLASCLALVFEHAAVHHTRPVSTPPIN